MNRKLPESTLIKLREFEPKLRRAAKYGQIREAERIIKEIQFLFVNDRSHYRILQAKNWYYQALLEDNQVNAAEQGFEAVRLRANHNTRTHLEATMLLGICCLRKRDIESAKKYIREAIQSINSIKSDIRRNQLQKRILERIEVESILGQLSATTSTSIINQDELHKKAVKMLQSKSDEEIYGLVGASIPQDSLKLIENIKGYSMNLLPPHDQKLLVSPIPQSNITFGKKVIDTIKRTGWRTICDPDSQIYNLWKNQVPEVFNKGYFASAVAATCAKFSIGLPILAIGVVAILMKYGAQEFCETFQPKDIMIYRTEKDD
ncbi:MAG: hypothetical protein GF364_09185 [Candidatus Lokiarchaeota archaeon]|nr:hypothetical protein [Candidatus Lokiarchaeota archaeon]